MRVEIHDNEPWFYLIDGTDENRPAGWAPASGLKNLHADGWVIAENAA